MLICVIFTLISVIDGAKIESQFIGKKYIQHTIQFYKYPQIKTLEFKTRSYDNYSVGIGYL